jgi:hypothetical protein
MGHRFPTIIPEAVRWDAERQAVVFGVAIGERRGRGPERPTGVPAAAPGAAYPPSGAQRRTTSS